MRGETHPHKTSISDWCQMKHSLLSLDDAATRGKNRLSPKELTKVIQTLEGERETFDLGKVLFPKQDKFGLDKARYQTAVCSRRAGKSIGAAARLIAAALSRPNSVALYVTLSRANAKRILWQALLELNREYGLGGEPKESELRMVFPNGANIYLSGASDKTEVDKFRGLALVLVLVDEAQALPSYLKQLVDEVLAPALMDFDGQLVLIGTPGPVPSGYFYECDMSQTWSHHSWTVFDNPWIERKSKKTPQQHLEEELKRRGVTVDDPVIQREWFGRWCYDPSSLVFRYNAQVNHYDSLPGAQRPWEYVIGVDLGFDDADAVCVLAWSESSPNLYLVEENVMAKQGITELANVLRSAWDKYSPLGVVADMGGLGKKIADELTRRTGIPMEAADKERKLEHIELLNDALRTGRMFAKKESRFAQDCLLVEWDKSNPEKPKISERFHSDICDAVLYAYRKAQHWLYQEPKAPKPQINTPEWLLEQERELEALAEKEVEDKRREREDGIESWI